MFLLQRYIARELIKTFVLTAIGLTIVFSLGGGVFNMIRVEVVTALQLWSILLRIVPIATTLTLPVAALFSAAIVYGRFSYDNEFNACRASGINILGLLTPAVLLGLFTTAFTFSFSNYIIPRFVEGLEQLVRQDPEKAVAQMLYARGYIKVPGEKYFIHADSFDEVTVEGRPIRSADEGGERFIQLKGAAFIEMAAGELVRYGTTPRVTIQFTAAAPGKDPTVMARMEDVRIFDQQRRQFYQLGEQQLGPAPIPWKFRRQNKFMNLPELLYYRERSWELPEVQGSLPEIRELVGRFFFYQTMIRSLTEGDKVFRLGSPRQGYEITAAGVRMDEEGKQVRLSQVVVRQSWGGIRRTFTAGNATVVVKQSFDVNVPYVYIELGGDVSFVDDVDKKKTVKRLAVELEPVPVSRSVLAQTAAVTDADLLDYRKPLGLPERIDARREGLAQTQLAMVRRLTTEIHSRFAFSASVLVLVVLGAALGVIFRGGQMLTAFVIAFLPGLFTTVMNVTGRQLSENQNTAMIGLAVIWTGIVLVAMADVVVLARFLRR